MGFEVGRPVAAQNRKLWPLCNTVLSPGLEGWLAGSMVAGWMAGSLDVGNGWMAEWLDAWMAGCRHYCVELARPTTRRVGR